MSITIVVGGQWGSEGKGKVAYWFAKSNKIPFVVRVGGSNSGHTVIDTKGNRYVFRILPTASIEENVTCILPAGTYIDLSILEKEIAIAALHEKRLKIHPNAMIITDEFIAKEVEGPLSDSIGSTNSGTGVAVMARVNRKDGIRFAKDEPALSHYLCDTTDLLRAAIDNGQEVLIEGTQGFGLSVLHSETYPYVTSRDTTAAGFLSETGLSPLDVINVIMVIRSYPIRVGGNSGPLPNEVTWEQITEQSGAKSELIEFTSVTNKVRRVAEFDLTVVKKAIQANKPNVIILNHCDYFDATSYDNEITYELENYIQKIEAGIGKIDFVGLSEKSVIKR
ncbi:MAG: adenylosuccinate synthetase [Prevotella sp.]|jgi:adenylosuccinate synthase|nr:adenylosuccinate synthetase [Prevotella sp.]